MYKFGDCRYETLLARKENIKKVSLSSWQKGLIEYNQKFASWFETKIKTEIFDVWKLDMRVHVLIQHGSIYVEPEEQQKLVKTF